jgi:hypothetical protein
MLSRGFLASDRFYPSCAHGDVETGLYLNAATEVFALIADAVKSGGVRQKLKGPVKLAGFTRLN